MSDSSNEEKSHQRSSFRKEEIHTGSESPKEVKASAISTSPPGTDRKAPKPSDSNGSQRAIPERAGKDKPRSSSNQSEPGSLRQKRSSTVSGDSPGKNEPLVSEATPATALSPPALPSFVQQYDPLMADQSVRLRNVFTDPRFLQMAKTTVGFTLECVTDKIFSNRRDQSEISKKRARRLRDVFVGLGPTFVKLGQFLSVRRDCLPQEMADELALLQDKVPPFSIEMVKRTISADLGLPPEEIFEEFDDTPIASASIGQVHRARLRDGKAVVVKVQRPDLAHRFYQDLGYMRLLVRCGLLIKPDGEWQSWLELSDEFGRHLFQEINYIQEGRNADRMRHALREQPGLRIPRVYWKHTGKRVLTLEYLPGIKVNQVKILEEMGVDLPKLGNQLVSCYLEQVLMHGFFHADPHAGNISVDQQGRIILYDFGMMGEISEEQRDAICGCIASVIKRDASDLVKHLIDLGIIKRDAQIGPVVRTLEPFIDYYSGKEVRELDFSHLEHDIDQIAMDRALQLPATLAYLLRAGTSLEGIARTLKPNFSFVEAAKQPLRKWVLSRPLQAASLIKLFINGNLNFGEEVILKLANGKAPELLVNARKGDKSKKSSAPEQLAQAASTPVISATELADLKSRIYFLESQVQDQKQRGLAISRVTIWLLTVCLFSAAAGLLTQYGPYVHYFLIGNGVMGAIIMWHLVTHLRLEKTPTKKGSFRGQRR